MKQMTSQIPDEDPNFGGVETPADPNYAGIPTSQVQASNFIATNLTFGQALEYLKRGHRVARVGWNGKGMWLILVPGTPNAELREGTPYAKALGQSSCEILPHIDMWTTNASGRRAMLPGWLASQSDMLSDDWVVVTG